MPFVSARLGVATFVAAVAALAFAPAATAHAIVLSAGPGNDSVLERSPEAVTLRFNEPVESAVIRRGGGRDTKSDPHAGASQRFSNGGLSKLHLG